MDTVKKFKSEYFDKPFSNELLNSRLFSGIGLFIMTFAFAGLLNYDHNEMRRHKFWSKAINGLQHMDLSDYFLTFFIAISAVSIVILMINLKYNERKIIVGFKFNSENNTLKLRIRKIASSYHTDIIIPYSEIELINERLSDGMTGPIYNCIRVSLKTYVNIFI